MAANPADPMSSAASYDVADLRDRLPEALGRVRDSRRPVLITEKDEPLAAIVNVEELERLYEVQELAEVCEIVRELEAAEARGDAEWFSMDQILDLQRRLLSEPAAALPSAAILPSC